MFFLLQYTFLLLLIFVLEASAGLLAFVYQEQVETELKMSLNSTFLQYYHVDQDRTRAIDHFQVQVKIHYGSTNFQFFQKKLTGQTLKIPQTRQDRETNVFLLLSISKQKFKIYTTHVLLSFRDLRTILRK